MLRSDCLHPPRLVFGILVPKTARVRRKGIRDVVRTWVWRLHEWDECFYKRDPGEHPCPFCRVNTGREVCHPEEDPHATMLAPCAQISSLHKCGKHRSTACLAFCCSSLQGLRQTTGYYWQGWRGRWTKVLGHGICHLWFGSWLPSYAICWISQSILKWKQITIPCVCIYWFVVVRVKGNSISTISELNPCVPQTHCFWKTVNNSIIHKKTPKPRKTQAIFCIVIVANTRQQRPTLVFPAPSSWQTSI